MGIHAKYNLTRYAFQNKEPEMHYSIDQYVVTVSSHSCDLEYIHKYSEWKEVRNYIDRICNDSEYDDYGFSISGLVFNQQFSEGI